MKNIRRSIALSVILIITAAACVLMYGCSCSDSEVPVPTTEPSTAAPTQQRAQDTPVPTEEPSPEPTATPEPEAVNNEFPAPDGSVMAISTGTFGMATDGTVRFMGRVTSDQHFVRDWSDAVQIAANDVTAAALLSDGSLVFLGEYADEYSEATAEWQDIVAIALGDAHLVGLKADGTVTAVGDNSYGQCMVDDWTRVIKIFACGGFTVGLTDEYGEGVYDTLHTFDLSPLPEELKLTDAAVAQDHIALLCDDGSVYVTPFVSAAGSKAEGGSGASSSSTSREGGQSGTMGRDSGEQGSASSRSNEPGSNPDRGGLTKLEWKNIAKVFASEGATFGVDTEGRLITDSDIFEEGETPENVYSLSASDKHIAVLYTDGTAEGFGNNDDMQCSIGGWRLLPYVTEDGYLLGYSEGSMIGEELYRTGLEVSFGDPASDDVSTVTAVLLGDLNGDGAITDADYSALTAHINGSAPLSGAKLRAANIIADSSRPEAVDVVDKDALRRHLDGRCPIDQFAKTDRYTAKLANAKRVNTDAHGYITIAGTNIDYPILYGDNWYYHTRALDGSYLERGSIYTYWGNPNKNIVITGHNARTTGTMLHQLHYVQDNYARNFGYYPNRLWCINVYGVTGYWEVWSMYEEGAFNNPNDSSLVYNTCYPGTMNVMSETQQRAWIDYQQRKSQLNYSVDVTTDDTFITIVTCGDTHYASEKGSRLYFFLRLVSGN